MRGFAGQFDPVTTPQCAFPVFRMGTDNTWTVDVAEFQENFIDKQVENQS